MKLRPRALRSHLILAALSALAFALSSTSAWAQQRRARPKPAAPAETSNAERARRSLAVTLLSETADKARLFDDLFYRARIQALAADALWPHDERQARLIFRRAWEAAEGSDRAEQEEAARESGAGAKVTEARDEVLRKAAARDSKLAELFLRDLSSAKNEGEAQTQGEPTRRTAWRELSASGARRLALAYELIEAGETQRAVEVAAPLVSEGVSASLVEFILILRRLNSEDADALYRRLLERAASDPRTDANALLLLSSPVISTSLMVVVDESSSLQFRALPPPRFGPRIIFPVSPRISAAFYNLAASVLLRPLPRREDGLTMQDLMSRFYATGRLLPFFEKSTEPYSSYAPALRAHQSELFNEIEAARREQFSSQFSVSSLSQTAATDPLRLEAEQLSRATDPVERSTLALSMVRAAVRNKSWDRARRAAAEVEDADLRRAALSFIQVHQVKDIANAYKDEGGDNYEGVAKFVREADVPPFAKAWGMAQAADIAARGPRPQTAPSVAGLINEAEGFAARADLGSPERVAAYAAVTDSAARLDPARAWGLLRELVKAANAVEDFTGDEAGVELVDADDMPGGPIGLPGIEAEVFRLDAIFATMALLDFDRALAEARALGGEAPRALATIAAARKFLEKQKSQQRSQ